MRSLRVRPHALVALLLACALAACAHASTRRVTDPDYPRALPQAGTVQVRWGDPAGFSEVRRSMNRQAAERGDWVVQLAEHVRARAAPRLPAGERLEVEFVDIERAGEFEAFDIAARDIRIQRDIHAPRVELAFRRLGADGSVLAEGTRSLRDPAYLMRGGLRGDNDPLRYEKRLLDDWLVRELPRAR